MTFSVRLSYGVDEDDPRASFKRMFDRNFVNIQPLCRVVDRRPDRLSIIIAAGRAAYFPLQARGDPLRPRPPATRTGLFYIRRVLT